ILFFSSRQKMTNKARATAFRPLRGRVHFFGKHQRNKRKRFVPRANPGSHRRGGSSTGHPCPIEKRRTSCAAPSGSAGDVPDSLFLATKSEKPEPRQNSEPERGRRRNFFSRSAHSCIQANHQQLATAVDQKPRPLRRAQQRR